MIYALPRFTPEVTIALGLIKMDRPGILLVFVFLGEPYKSQRLEDTRGVHTFFQGVLIS